MGKKIKFIQDFINDEKNTNISLIVDISKQIVKNFKKNGYSISVEYYAQSPMPILRQFIAEFFIGKSRKSGNNLIYNIEYNYGSKPGEVFISLSYDYNIKKAKQGFGGNIEAEKMQPVYDIINKVLDKYSKQKMLFNPTYIIKCTDLTSINTDLQ